MPRVVINQVWWENISPSFRYSEPQSDFSRMQDRLRLLRLQSICPHLCEDPIIIVVGDVTIGSIGWLARDVARGMEFQVEVSCAEK